MPHSAHETYLETQVLTATPQKLRLMLIEGAIRFGRRALEVWEDEDRRDQKLVALTRCNDILLEIYGSIQGEGPLDQQVREIYRFLLLQMAHVTSHNERETLEEVLGVLESERQTWRAVCEQSPEAPPLAAPLEEITAAGMPAIAPGISSPAAIPGATAGGFSLEA